VKTFFAIVVGAFIVFSGCDMEPVKITNNNSMNTAYEVSTTGYVYDGEIANPTLSNWYRFEGEKGSGYRVEVIWKSGENLDIWDMVCI